MRTPSMAITGCLAALVGCEAPCWDGSQPELARYVVCDEESRMCEEHTQLRCPCDSRRSSCDGTGGCRAAAAGNGDWVTQLPTENRHVVDGQFTLGEWSGATRLEGLFTDAYMDYRDGRLYFLNDWRSNDEGIREDCFNYFRLRVGADELELRVYGSGEVTVTRNSQPISVAAAGAYGFGPSPEWAQPHTIYEFSLAVEAEQIDVCCFDPVTLSSCDVLAHEPAVMSIRADRGGVSVRRAIASGSVPRLAEGAACGSREGICDDGLSCVDRVCRAVRASLPDGGTGEGVDGGPPG